MNFRPTKTAPTTSSAGIVTKWANGTSDRSASTRSCDPTDRPPENTPLQKRVAK